MKNTICGFNTLQVKTNRNLFKDVCSLHNAVYTPRHGYKESVFIGGETATRSPAMATIREKETRQTQTYLGGGD
jgi:hypothetical protein